MDEHMCHACEKIMTELEICAECGNKFCSDCVTTCDECMIVILCEECGPLCNGCIQDLDDAECSERIEEDNDV